MSYKKSPFENAPKKNVNKTRFNHSHEHKMQMLPGQIFPCMRPLEVMPGDEVSIQSQYFMRWESLYFPIMHKLTMRADTYYIPNRILWPKGTGTNVGWMDWLTKMEESDHPHFTATMTYDSTAFDRNVLAYMGIPFLPDSPSWDTAIEGLNAFPLSAYLMIWDWYERNPQLEDEVWFPLTDGDNTVEFNTAFGVNIGEKYQLFSSKWEKDMFTSALPQPQVGNAILIPQVRSREEMLSPEFVNGPKWIDLATGLPSADGAVTAGGGVGNVTITGGEGYYDPMDVAATMRQLREAEVLQAFHERVMKIGDRYDDYILGLYGNHPQPGIINIPVLIGSTFGKVNIADVFSTTDQITANSRMKVGDYAGQANLYEEGQKMTYTCNEHGFILQLIQINANTGYGQGIERLWRRSVQTDYPLDMFATIGDQEILKEEILYTGNTADVNAGRHLETFGYIDRFAEAKFKNDLYVGNLSQAVGLSQHLGRWWDPLTTIGADYDDDISLTGGLYQGFINASSNTQGGHRLVDVFRVLPSTGINYPAQGTTFSWIFHSIWINRNLPLYSTPSL